MDQEQNTTQHDGFPAASPEKSNLSMFVGVGAFIIILAGLGWYVIQGGTMTGEILPSKSPTPDTAQVKSTQTATSSEDAAAAALSTQGTSDSVADIEADLKATNLDSLDAIDQI